ncbi:hypothetical protein M440DRAFT_1163158 [Trichoderma longibrachiatum ATCC 18648]|uniref:Uncharacterized protein n=1 Tax=Trichoderma longibrachiatum ATCC 18648 TaxID=983965 RepID=A0A2T4CCC2_TRILO|nr:hypothetical protein M440DRAFT_1163158 [Trichoderma longibrachiatum ATCC 18648]
MASINTTTYFVHDRILCDSTCTGPQPARTPPEPPPKIKPQKPVHPAAELQHLTAAGLEPADGRPTRANSASPHPMFVSSASTFKPPSPPSVLVPLPRIFSPSPLHVLLELRSRAPSRHRRP